MRLDELEEAEVKKVVFTFGRLNPPHFGHHALIQTLQKAAQKQNCDWFLFVSSKTGDEKNPLTYEQKVWWIQTLFPETKGHLIIDQKIKTPLVAATWLYKQGYTAATFVAGEDDMASYGEMIKSGNAHGQANPTAVKQGKGFIFNPLDFAISPRLASATNARKNVTDGDPEAFVRSILGPKISPELAKLVQDQLYPTLRKTMGLGESIEESYHVFPTVREIAQKHMTTPDEVHRQINRGVKVEFERNQDIETATDIAMANLTKNFEHYKRFAKIEDADPKKKFGENFADGKGPGRPGDSQRHGIPKKSSIAQLEKASHADGRKGQLARWQLNMRRGKKKANEEITNEVADQPYRFISPVSTSTAQKSMFQTDSGTKMQVNIIVDQSSGTADIGFYDSTDKDNPSIAMTGKGDAFRIFATVGAIVKQFVAKRKPPFLSFAGKSTDPGRIKLYDMIAKNIGRYLPEYKLIDSSFANGDKGYTFQRVAQESVSEEKKPKKPKTIIDGALKTLIAKGRSEDEAIADLKKEIDSKFYELDESREGALNWLKSYLPSWPEYVLRDWLYRGLTAKDHDPTEHPKEVVDRSLAGEGMSAQTQWKLIPNFEFKLEKLHPDTQRRIKIRAGGSSNPMNVPKDAERHATQAALAQQQGGVRKEPVIGKMTPQGFELIEGWHRTIQHFKQFPNGYSGPAWVAMNAQTTENWSPMELAIMEGGHLLDDYDENLEETLKKVKGKWALVSRKNLKKVLQYYHGDGHPSKDWVSKVERRVHSFESIMEDESVKPRVYLDMDGVLADFFGEWSRISNVDHYKDIDDVEAKLQLVRDHPTFWVDLPLLPHAKALIKTVIEKYGEYRICSKPLEGDARSKPGKMEWIRNNLSDMMPVEVILTDNKAAFATQDGIPSILVDDYGVNISAWKAAGGIGIKYDDSAFPKVANVLSSIAKSGVPK